MIVPFGFSVGDFIAVVGLTKAVIVSLRAQGGAVDACLVVVNELGINISVFQDLENVDLPAKYEAQQRSIVALAQSLNNSASKFLESLQKYRRNFAARNATRFYRASFTKAK